MQLDSLRQNVQENEVIEDTTEAPVMEEKTSNETENEISGILQAMGGAGPDLIKLNKIKTKVLVLLNLTDPVFYGLKKDLSTVESPEGVINYYNMFRKGDGTLDKPIGAVRESFPSVLKMVSELNNSEVVIVGKSKDISEHVKALSEAVYNTTFSLLEGKIDWNQPLVTKEENFKEEEDDEFSYDGKQISHNIDDALIKAGDLISINSWYINSESYTETYHDSVLCFNLQFPEMYDKEDNKLRYLERFSRAIEAIKSSIDGGESVPIYIGVVISNDLLIDRSVRELVNDLFSEDLVEKYSYYTTKSLREEEINNRLFPSKEKIEQLLPYNGDMLFVRLLSS